MHDSLWHSLKGIHYQDWRYQLNSHDTKFFYLKKVRGVCYLNFKIRMKMFTFQSLLVLAFMCLMKCRKALEGPRQHPPFKHIQSFFCFLHSNPPSSSSFHTPHLYNIFYIFFSFFNSPLIFYTSLQIHPFQMKTNPPGTIVVELIFDLWLIVSITLPIKKNIIIIIILDEEKKKLST